MATTKVSELDVAQEIADSDLLLLSQDVGGGVLESRKVTLGTLGDKWVDTTGDTMTGPLVFRYEWTDPELPPPLYSDFTISWSEVGDARGQFALTPDESSSIVSIHGGSAFLSTSGQVITGRFRFCHDVRTVGSGTIMESGASGYVTSVARATSASPITVYLRKNTGALVDFHQGARVDIFQQGAGQVTLAGETAGVTLLYPSDKIPATRTQYSTITATLITGGQEDDTSETWYVSGDLANAP